MVKGLWYRVAPHFAQNALVTKDRTTTSKVRKVGKVVYVHPKGRFVTMEFKGVKGYARECFRPEELGNPVPTPRRTEA